MKGTHAMTLLYASSEWDFATLKRIHDACEEIAVNELGLTFYRNQIEAVTSEQMLELYSSNAMPLMYKHWSFGKSHARDSEMYRRGHQGLAYEVVINSDPCIAYVMEENSATMQTLVIAHASFGHNHFFKNNKLFKQWTDAAGILDYLSFAKDYVETCERQHGRAAVERILDGAHALRGQGIDRYQRRTKRAGEDQARRQALQAHAESTYDLLWTTLPNAAALRAMPADERQQIEMALEKRLGLPEENVLYLLEKHGPKLEPWERELIRIVRRVAQYFHPQRQTKMMNEGCATYVHYRILTRLHENGQISDGNFQEFLASHTAVVMQPAWDDPRHSGWNPYALGFAMMQDIERICTVPTEEDREWFPDIAGCGEPMRVLRDAWADHRDESFVLQFLSPHLMRKLRMFHVDLKPDGSALRVGNIGDEFGYREVRRQLARSYDPSVSDPNIQAVEVNLMGDRRLVLEHSVHGGRTLDEGSTKMALQHLAGLWGYPVQLRERDAVTDAILHTTNLSPPPVPAAKPA